MLRNLPSQVGSMVLRVLLLSAVIAAIPVLTRAQTAADAPTEKNAPEGQLPQKPAVKTVPPDLIPTLVKPVVSCEQTCAQSKAFDPSFQRHPPHGEKREIAGHQS